MKRNIALVTAMMILFSGLSMSVQAAGNPPKAKAHTAHKHHHAPAHKPADAPAK